MIRGILPALITPMNGDGTAVNYEALPKLVNFFLSREVDGFFVCGGSGEGLLLRPEERRRILEIVVERTKGRAAIIAHVGALATQEAQALASHAQSLHVDAIAAVPPVYFRVDDDALFDHYRLIAEAAPDTPIWVYQIPSTTCVDINAEKMSHLLEIDNVSGIKYSSYNLYDLANILALSQDVNVLSGFDEVLMAALSMGAHGGIGSTYNVMPASFVRLYRTVRAGRWDEARTLQQRINRVIQALLTVPIIAGIKMILTEQGIPCGAPRRPLPPLDEEAKTALLHRLEEVGYWQLEEESHQIILDSGGEGMHE
jgi:N-acetylneuraminate lyase